jgi:hypothetical protein
VGLRVSDRASASGSRAGVDVRGPGGSEGERERADAKLGRAGGALASGVKGWAGVESGPREQAGPREGRPGWGFLSLIQTKTTN